MKILVLADHAEPKLWEHLDRRRLEGIGLVISCGDLPPAYLSFLTCFTHAPVLYVHGNHDGRYEKDPPEGCVCIDGEVYVHEGVRIAGLGGSMRYNPNAPHQYTEREMRRRIRRLTFRLRRFRGIDILVTHAPARGLNDMDDLAHRGFSCFLDLLEKYEPKFFVHGHIHQEYGASVPQKCSCGKTVVVNAYDHCVINYEPGTEKMIPNDCGSGRNPKGKD